PPPPRCCRGGMHFYIDKKSAVCDAGHAPRESSQPRPQPTNSAFWRRTSHRQGKRCRLRREKLPQRQELTSAQNLIGLWQLQHFPVTLNHCHLAPGRGRAFPGHLDSACSALTARGRRDKPDDHAGMSFETTEIRCRVKFARDAPPRGRQFIP